MGVRKRILKFVISIIFIAGCHSEEAKKNAESVLERSVGCVGEKRRAFGSFREMFFWILNELNCVCGIKTRRQNSVAKKN